MFILRNLNLLCILCLAFFASQSFAQQTNWQPLHPQYGTGNLVCASDAAGYDCFALQCHPERGVEFAIYTSKVDASAPDLAVLSVDGGPEIVQSWRDVGVPGQKVQNLDYFNVQDFLTRLGRGQTLQMRMKKTFQFPIAGAKQVIDDVFAACASNPSTRFKSYTEMAQADL